MRKFCANCGKPGDFPNYLCPDCTPEPPPAKEIPPTKVCRSCKRMFSKGRWGNGTPAHPVYVLCPDCGRANSEYWEAVVQVPKKLDPKAVIEVSNEIVGFHQAMGRASRLVKVEDTQYFYSNPTVARLIARRLKARFGLKIKEHTKLVGRDRRASKDIHKITINLS